MKLKNMRGLKSQIIKMKLWIIIKFGNPTKEDYIAYSLYTKEGRRALGRAMVEPLLSRYR